MPAKKPPRRARLIVIAVVLLLVAGIGYGTYWSVGTVRNSFPQTTGSLEIDGLSDRVTVKRGEHGVPQVYADSAHDLFMAQGFVHAQDRFWEMDVRRHTTSGRLSELFGESQVRTDAFLRTLGWREVAEREFEKLDPDTRAYLKAYADGVNAYLADNKGSELSVEHAALKLDNGYEPESWDPVDSVAWLKAMAWDLRANMEDEIDRALMTTRLSREEIEDLYPTYPYDRNRPIVEGGTVGEATGEFLPEGAPAPGTDPGTAANPGTDPGTAANPGTDPGTAANPGAAGTQQAVQGGRGALASVAEALEKAPSLLGPSGSGIGSNSWVVSGEHTTTGKPLLANDPHLAPQLPSVWTQMGLHCRSVTKKCPFDVSGFTFSGMPGVVIGHNQSIAWGLTNLGADVTDLYLQKIEGGKYLYDGKQVPFTTRREVIKVAGGEAREITVRGTNNGPIVSDFNTEATAVGEETPVEASAPDRGDGYAVSLRWTALKPSRSMDAVFALNKATNFEEFRAAARLLTVPAQNLIYADTEGNIGYQAPGRIPIRADGHSGRYPAPGWDPDHRWTGYVPQSALPWEYNPDRGYIVTANQAVVDQRDYPYTLTQDWSYGVRSQRIDDLVRSKIEDGGKVSMQDMQEMQTDNSSEIAKLLVPYLLKIDVEDAYVREAQELLRGWDYTQDSDSAAAAYFNAVWRNVLMLAFGDKLSKEVRVEGDCVWVPPADESAPLEDLDGDSELVRECGKRDADSAQPDGGGRWTEVVRGLLDQPDSAWWKTRGTDRDPGATGRDELLAEALEDARWELTSELGKDIDTWSWGRLHRLMLKNQTIGTDGPGYLQWLLNRGPWDLGGGEATVNATGWNAAGGYDVSWVPSMRMVVNLDDFDESSWINLTGASGHTYHPHYVDQTDLWAEGEQLPWAYGDQAVEKGTEDKMVLMP
ncbi:penicillin acylase family protein [Streptomyces sp. DSM 42041]|uniref:Penicillin acylase family protein n=1 Tax=Streptomyces hazeniae TaxID=3075538 RepID=A0ABU2NR31_9ACTN|nr:penicillin acylase family protein [Streptomyces sp. DSM 42041]MDT0379434.1 penicillin acylase family protein [Streptomyces sp. DSM 42041]